MIASYPAGTPESVGGLRAYRNWAENPIVGEPSYSVVIPAYNEEWRILPTVGAIASHMSGLGEPWELIVADDGSTDNTVALLQELGLANMTILIAERNGGKGSAVRRGMLAARGDIVLFADADQSTPIEHFSDLLSELDAGADVAVGSRGHDEAEVENKSRLRKILSGGLNVVVRRIFRLPVSDTQCGFKMFTADAAQLLFGRQLIDEFSFDLEVLYLARKFDLQTAEVPVTWIDAPDSKVSPLKVALEFVRDIGVIAINDLRGRYGQINHPDQRRSLKVVES